MKRIVLACLGWVGVSVALLCPACSRGDPEAAASAPARAVLYYRDPMHPSYTSATPGKAPDCGMDLEPVYAATGDSQGTSASAPPGALPVSGERQHMIGLRLDRVSRSRTSGVLRALGRVALDESRVFPVRAGCEGSVTRIFPGAATGSTVRNGQSLASVYGRDFTTAQRSLLHALRASQNPPPVLPGDDASQTVLSLQEARLSLRSIGLGKEQIRQLEQTRQVMLDVLVTAPAAGVIVARNVFPQQRFERDAELFRIADLSRVWIVADLSDGDHAALGSGAVARVFLPGRPAVALRATVGEALALFDGGSRTLKLRLDAENPRLILRPDMFVDLEFPVVLPEATTVPADAIVQSGLETTVYVARGEGIFEPRVVETGWRFGGRVEIVRGLEPGESIVTSGNFLLDSENRMRHGDAGGHD